MKLRYISSYFALAFLFFTIEPTNASTLNNIYTGLAVSWDHVGGKSYGVITNHAGSHLIFSNGNSLKADKMNGYAFIGTVYTLPQQSIFISPEFQIGQGNVDCQIKNTAADPNLILSSGPLQRRLDLKLNRQLTTSFVGRIGRKLFNSLQLYGLLGVEASRFKYSYVVENVDAISGEINGFKTFLKSKWKIAPLFGIGIDKAINKFRIGLEYRFSSYGPIKASRTVFQSASTEWVSTKVKPYISSLMLKFCYGV